MRAVAVLAAVLLLTLVSQARAEEVGPAPPPAESAALVPEPLSAQVIERLDVLERKVTILGEEASATRNELEARTGPESQAGAGEGTVLLAGPKGELRVAVFAQLRYALELAEKAPDGSGPELLTQGFAVRRARATLAGWAWDPRVTYQLQLEYAGNAARATDAYMEVALPCGGLSLRAGQFKVPFSWIVMASDQNMSFVERPVMTEELAYDRDIGVALNGHVSRAGARFFPDLEYSLAGFNGAGRAVANDNRDLLLAGHVRMTLLGKPWKDEGDLAGAKDFGLALELDATWENAPVPSLAGTAAAPLTLDTDIDGDGKRDNVAVTQAVVGLSARWHGVSLDAEHVFRHEDWGAIGAGQSPAFSPRDSLGGFYVQAQWFVWPEHLQLGARYGDSDVSPVLVQRQRSTAPLADQRSEFSAIASYHRWAHGFELTLMYSFLDWKSSDGSAAAGLGEHRFILETQVAF
jgi:hypothetical protein